MTPSQEPRFKLSLLPAAWLLLLFLELEVLTAPNYEIRTALRAQVGFPVYHVFLGFLAFAVFLRLMARERLPVLPTWRFCWAALVANGLLFGLLTAFLRPLWLRLQHFPPGLELLSWSILAAVYLATWFWVLVAPAQWPRVLRSHAPWLSVCALAGVLSFGLTQLTNLLYPPFASATFTSTVALLRPLVPEVVTIPESWDLGTSTFLIHLEPGCSGYEGIGLITLFLSGFVFLRRRELSFPSAWSLFPIGISLIWLANIVRLAALVLIGTYISEDVAMRGFHSQAGWLMFTSLSMALVVGVEHLGWFRKDQVQFVHVSYPAAPYVVPLLVLLFAQMLSRAFSVGFDLFYPLRIGALGLALFWYRRDYRRMRWKRPALFSVAVGLAVYVVWVVLIPGAPDHSVDEVLLSPWKEGWLLFRVAGSSLVIPLVEELAFRGYLLRRLQSPNFKAVPQGRMRPLALTGSSLAFGFLHGNPLAGTLAGLSYALTLAVRGQLGDAVAAHAVTNSCIALQVLWLGHWSLWS